MSHRTTRRAGQRGGGLLYLTLSMGGAAALALLFAYFTARAHLYRDIKAQVAARADRISETQLSFEDPAVSPVVNKVAQWFGLCSAYAATTVAGFKAQVLNDPQLMEQYRDFDWSNAVVIENSADMYSSVLYKKNEKFYWTKKLLLIRKGEKVITDGKVQVRTYCCNQIALVPPGPFLPPADEPPPQDIQPPVAPGLPDFPALSPPTIDIPPELIALVPPVAPPIARRPGFFFGERRPTGGRIPVPEPGTFILLMSGLGALALFQRRRRR